jgi:hypothetical protein
MDAGVAADRVGITARKNLQRFCRAAAAVEALVDDERLLRAVRGESSWNWRSDGASIAQCVPDFAVAQLVHHRAALLDPALTCRSPLLPLA